MRAIFHSGRAGRYRWAAALLLPAAALSPVVAHAATSTTTLYVSATGSGTACSSAAPCSLTQARSSVEAVDSNMSGDITVQLAGGTYRLSAPLAFTSADSGSNGYTVTWQGAPGATPVLTGAEQVGGWQLQNQANNVWVANVGTGVNSRQLYVNGTEAPRAAITVPRSDFSFTQTGLTITNSSLNYLDGLSDQNQIEVEGLNSFTDRYTPVQSISGTSITMQQPAWDNNTWGYDTMESPFAGGTLYLENNYAFLQSGQWYLDSATGQLFYEAPSGQSPNNMDVELPRLQSLVDISGSYSNPVKGLEFNGIQFSGTSWLGPSGANGYADEQNGAFTVGNYQMPSGWLSTCNSGCTQFEATRNGWNQIPGAVQVSAASDIGFSGDTFTQLGQVGLAVGEDADANASGTGLGASGITITGSTFSDDAADGIVVGGVQPNAHHPSNPAMTNQKITISDNHVTGTGTDYKETSAILSTYVSNATITHNQVDHLPYDGIDIGWGWGVNDPGGSQDYVNRGTYNYQPVYTTPTTLMNNTVSYNLIYDTKSAMHDGGSIYNLSASPGTVISNNYMYNNNGTVALYLDEGSRYVTLSNNVVQDAGVWAFTNANGNNNTDDNTFSNNWYNGGATNVATGSPHNNVLSGNVQVSGYSWPSGAQQVIAQAGIQQSGGAFPSGYRRLIVGNDSLCLDVYGATGAAGAAIDQWSCNGQSNQEFQFVPVSGGYGELQAQNSGDDVAVTGNATAAGTPDIVQEPVSGSAGSLWLPLRQSDGSYEFRNQGSGLCLDVYGNGSNLGQQLDQWQCKNAPGDNQDFTAG